MSSRDCRGYTEYTAKCSECDFEESINSISMSRAHAKLSVDDGDNCPEEGCNGKITIEEKEVSEDEHKQEYLSHLENEGEDIIGTKNKGGVSNMDEKILSLINAGKTDEEIVEIMAKGKSEKEVQDKIDKMELMKNTPKEQRLKTGKNIYKVSMTESNAKLYKIEATDEDEAVEICEEKWNEGTLGRPIKSEIVDRFFQLEESED